MQSWQRQHLTFIALLAGIFLLIGLLSVRYDYSFDVTDNQRHQLSKASLTVLAKVEEPLFITAFTRGNPKVKALVQRVLNKYLAHTDIRLDFKNPDTQVDLVKKYQIERDGELLLTYKNNKAHVRDLSEISITKAIHQLVSHHAPNVMLLSGHGERGLNPKLGTDYGQLKLRLSEQNIALNGANLSLLKSIPENTDLLVIADPQRDLLEAEISILENYLVSGGNLLWLSETDSKPLPLLSRQLGIGFSKQVVINQSSKKYRLHNPETIIVEPRLSDRRQFQPLTMIDSYLAFLQTGFIKVLPIDVSKKWQATPLLQVTEQSYLKSDNTIKKASLPLSLGVLLTPKLVSVKQKIVAIADADFLSNQFIGLGQNADFSEGLFNYLTEAEPLVMSSLKQQPEAVIITDKTVAYLGLVFIIILPVVILLVGAVYRRRRYATDYGKPFTLKNDETAKNI